MLDVLKKTLMAGVGATVITAEKLETALDDLVKKGKLTAEEARETARRVADDSSQEFEEAQRRLESLFEDFLGRARVATQTELKALEERVVQLEAAVPETASAES
jgi:polyhydroxyalkanoate synthesis regulator phasin